MRHLSYFWSKCLDMKKNISYKVNDNDVNNNILSDSISSYGFANDNHYNQFSSNPLLINTIIEKGVSFSIFEDLQNMIAFSEQKFADILSLSIKSLQRYKKDKSFRFKPIHSEKLIELSEVANFGLSVFDSKSQFNLWLNTPSFVLGNKKPADLLSNSYGIKLVMEELNRIEHGIFV